MLSRREFFDFSPLRQTRTAGYWLHVSRYAMACRFEATLPLSDRARLRAAQRALDEIDQLEQQLTIFRETSEVSQINRTASRGPVRIERSLFTLLQLCKTLHAETEGAFDITTTPLSRSWGFLKRQGRIPEAAEIEAAMSLVGSDKLSLDPSSCSAHFQSPGLTINLGSIGKGFALDRVAANLARRVRSTLLVAGSSSILAIGSGDRGDEGWVVGVRHPRDAAQRLAVLRMRDCAMSTSGGGEQSFEYQGRRYGHIIDPRTGCPAEQVSGVTVVARSGALSDGLATAFYVGGPQLAESYCAAHPGVMAIMLESRSDHP